MTPPTDAPSPHWLAIPVCSWCQPDPVPPPGVKISHGICPDCLVRVLAEIPAPTED